MLPESVGWLNEIPVKDIERWGWLRPLANSAAAAAACLQFFGVPSVGAWREVYGDALAAAYRTSPTYKSEPGAVAAWMRHGEIAASSIECGLWDPERFQRELSALRELTRVKDPAEFLPELVRRCAACGGAVVVLRTPKLCRASGVVRFLSPTRPMILLSFRYLSDDQFWFTFFHEAGHLLLHGDRCIFLEGDDTLTTEEDEANAFAANILMPPEYQAEMLRLPLDGRAVMRFARKVGVSPGVVVGQLQHHGRFRRNQLNNLKRRYTWVED